MVRCVGVIGGGRDPMETAFAMKTPEEAAAYLRDEEQTPACSEIRRHRHHLHQQRARSASTTWSRAASLHRATTP